MIELNKLEKGEVTLNLQPFSPAQAIRDIIQACSMGGHRRAGDAGDGGVAWVNEADAALPALVEARFARCACEELCIADDVRAAALRRAT